MREEAPAASKTTATRKDDDGFVIYDGFVIFDYHFYNSNLLTQNLHEQRREWQIKGLSERPISRIMDGLMAQVALKQWWCRVVWSSRVWPSEELEFEQRSFRRY